MKFFVAAAGVVLGAAAPALAFVQGGGSIAASHQSTRWEKLNHDMSSDFESDHRALFRAVAAVASLRMSVACLQSAHMPPGAGFCGGEEGC